MARTPTNPRYKAWWEETLAAYLDQSSGLPWESRAVPRVLDHTESIDEHQGVIERTQVAISYTPDVDNVLWIHITPLTQPVSVRHQGLFFAAVQDVLMHAHTSAVFVLLPVRVETYKGTWDSPMLLFLLGQRAAAQERANQLAQAAVDAAAAATAVPGAPARRAAAAAQATRAAQAAANAQAAALKPFQRLAPAVQFAVATQHGLVGQDVLRPRTLTNDEVQLIRTFHDFYILASGQGIVRDPDA